MASLYHRLLTHPTGQHHLPTAYLQSLPHSIGLRMQSCGYHQCCTCMHSNAVGDCEASTCPSPTSLPHQVRRLRAWAMRCDVLSHSPRVGAVSHQTDTNIGRYYPYYMSLCRTRSTAWCINCLCRLLCRLKWFRVSDMPALDSVTHLQCHPCTCPRWHFDFGMSFTNPSGLGTANTRM
jgi:hypothetical protein